MSVSPGHRGALDVYVPLVDWGARFEAIRAPDPHPCRPADRQPRRGDRPRPGPVARHRQGPRRGRTSAHHLPHAAARASTVLAGAALGLLVAFAIRSQIPRLRWTAPTVVIVALGIGVALVAADPAARRDLQPAVLRPRPGHPARAGGGRGGAAHAGRARPGARRAARRPRPPGGRSRPPAEPRGPAGDHGRLRPAQQHGRARRAGARRERRAACSSSAT